MSLLKKRVRSAGLLFVFGLCLTTGAFGFDLAIGVKAGCTFPCYSGPGYQSWLSGNAFSSKIKFGLSGGAFMTIGIVDFLAIQPEVFFSQLGAHSGDDYYTWKDKTNSIDIQALLKVRIQTRLQAMVDLFVGPSLQIKIGAEDFEVTDIYKNVVLTGYWYDEYLRIPLLGLVFGLGLEFPMRSYVFTVDGRYSMGMLPRFTDSSGAGKWYQNCFQLMIGFGYVLVGKLKTVSGTR